MRQRGTFGRIGLSSSLALALLGTGPAACSWLRRVPLLGEYAAAGQSVSPDVPVEDPFARAGITTGPHLDISTLMEVTIFNIDVLTLTVRVTTETRDQLLRIVRDRSYSEELADSVAAVVLEADEAWGRQVLERDVGYGRLVDGIRETTEKAAEAGYVSTSYLEEFSASLPDLFGFLREDGAREGDEILFAVEGGTTRTLYRSVDGRIRMDRTTDQEEARLGSIAAFFAPDTRFRKGLVESLIEAAEAEAAR